MLLERTVFALRARLVVRCHDKAEVASSNLAESTIFDSKWYNNRMNAVTDSSFGKEVEEASDGQVVIVNFSASWCGPCKAMKPQVEALEAKTTGVKFVHCDIDEAPTQTEKFGVMGVPTYVVIRDRKEQARFTGSGPQVLSGIQESIEKFSV